MSFVAMSSAAISAPAGVEPSPQQPPLAAPNQPPGPAPSSLADTHAQHVAQDAPQTNGSDPPVPRPSLQSRSPSAVSWSPSQADSQGPLPASPSMAPPRDGSLPAVSLDNDVARPSPRAQPAPPFPPPGPARPLSASHPSTSARSALESTPEYSELAEAVKRTSPHVVRLVVRNLSKLCLLGSEYHLSFLAHTAFDQASSSTLDRSVQDFGEKMVKSSKRHIVEHLTAADFDEVADAILAKVSNEFLDKALARRLETIRARELVNALARAERLGYDVQDIVEEKTANGAEHVVPCFDPTTALSLSAQPKSSQPPRTPQPAVEPARPQVLGAQSGQAPYDLSTPRPIPPNPHDVSQCTRCGRFCSGEQALRYHTTRRACEYTPLVERVGKDICPHCGCLFVSSGGLTYHVKSKVCGDYPEAVEKIVLTQLHANRTRSSFTPTTNLSVRTGTPASSPLKTPGQMVSAIRGSGSVNSATPSRGHAIPADGPYAKLGPEERRNFEMEMKKAEDKYGGLMREAMKLPLAERENELTRLKNSFNSKQSVTRKKYGIRLRERRSKAEIESERHRLVGVSRDDVAAPSPKRPRLSEGQAASRVPESHPAAATGGGLAGSSGTAEHTDPTTLTPSEPRAIKQAPPHRSAPKGTPGDPMQIDDDSSGTDTDDNDDIPATLSARAA